jgi:hypothetical protein
MVLGGLWHGAAWTFVIWGAFHGGLLAIHRWWSETSADGPGPASPAVEWGKRFAMFHLVCVGWVFFRAGSTGQAMQVLGAVAGDFSLAGARFDSLVFYCLPLVLVQWAQWRTGDPFALWRLHWIPRAIVYSALWFLMTLLGDYSGGQFIYFQF